MDWEELFSLFSTNWRWQANLLTDVPTKSYDDPQTILRFLDDQSLQFQKHSIINIIEDTPDIHNITQRMGVEIHLYPYLRPNVKKKSRYFIPWYDEYQGGTVDTLYQKVIQPFKSKFEWELLCEKEGCVSLGVIQKNNNGGLEAYRF
jgi:hypothetical protein